jgi:hypothetical protein
MLLSQQPNQWSNQLGPSLANSYNRQQKFDRGTKNPEGIRNNFENTLHNSSLDF